MKQLQVWFEDNNFELIQKIKVEIHGGNWHDFIMDIARKYKGELYPSGEDGDSGGKNNE